MWESVVGFKYSYQSFNEMLMFIKSIFDYSPLEYVLLWWTLVFTVAFILYWFPIIIIAYNTFDTMRKKAGKSYMLKKITYQKDINEAIEKEFKEEQEQAIEARLKTKEVTDVT